MRPGCYLLHAAKQTVGQTNVMSPAEAEQQAWLQVAQRIEQTNARLATSAFVPLLSVLHIMQLADQLWLLP